MNYSQQQLLITDNQIIAPLVEVLEEVTARSPGILQPKEISPSLKESLNNLFPEQQYDEKNIQKAKEILGKLADEFSSVQLKGVVAEVQYLAENWLDDFERKIFKGLTLNELLHEKGGI
jgi:hypothetical protein